jgi:hypothetical protein
MKEKQANVINMKVYLQTAAQQMVTTFTVWRNYCNNINKKMN